MATSVDIYRRDGYRCRYCGERLILDGVLVLMHTFFPSEIGYVTTYKHGQMHPLFWTAAPECDHLVPGTRGGSWTDPSNLVAACVRCNTLKADLLVDELGWTVRAPTIEDWDGLASAYDALWASAGSPNPGRHRRWVTALRSSSP